MPALPLSQSESATLDGSGNATIRQRPDGSHERWTLATVHNKVTGSGSPTAPEAVCRTYVGPSATDPYFVDATGSGSFGDSTDRVAGRIIGRTADPWVWSVWTGGEPGATATMIVTGTKTVTT